MLRTGVRFRRAARSHRRGGRARLTPGWNTGVGPPGHGCLRELPGIAGAAGAAAGHLPVGLPGCEPAHSHQRRAALARHVGPVQMLAEGARASARAISIASRTRDERRTGVARRVVQRRNCVRAGRGSKRHATRSNRRMSKSTRDVGTSRTHSRARGHGGHFARHGRPDFDRQRRGRAVLRLAGPAYRPPPRSSSRCCGWRRRCQRGRTSRPSRK